jgi:hypothetical protein
VYQNGDKWIARLHTNGTVRNLGSSCSEEEATAARRTAIASLAEKPGRQRWTSAVGVYDDDDRDWVEIELSKDRWAKVDLADLGLVIGWCWQCISSGYAYRSDPERQRSVPMHREILGLPDDDPRDVDHINHDKLDNRRANLRIATRSQNMGNMRRNQHSSQYRGVSRLRQKWMARINGQHSRYLGWYESEIEAAYAYDAVAKETFRQSSGGLHQHKQDPLKMPDPRTCRSKRIAFLPWRQIDGYIT